MRRDEQALCGSGSIQHGSMTAKYPPRSIQENAVNCMEILREFLLAKGISDIDQVLRQ